MSADADALAVELGRALTGEELALTSSDPEGLVEELAAAGWGQGRLVELRHARQTAEEPWPFPVRREVVSTVGFAVFHARLQALRQRLGLTGLQPQPQAVRPLNADERRLCEDRPPHWG